MKLLCYIAPHFLENTRPHCITSELDRHQGSRTARGQRPQERRSRNAGGRLLGGALRQQRVWAQRALRAGGGGKGEAEVGMWRDTA